VTDPVQRRKRRVAFYLARVHKVVEEDAEAEHHEELGDPVQRSLIWVLPEFGVLWLSETIYSSFFQNLQLS
jgi:hypothetical protein